MSFPTSIHSCHPCPRLSTFLLVGQLVISLAAAAVLAAGGVGAEGALAHEGGAAGVEGGRHAALLLPALLPLQTGGEGTAHRVAQSLPLAGRQRNYTLHTLATPACGLTSPSFIGPVCPAQK